MSDEKLNILMFSNNYDKALAGLILANSAIDLGLTVTMFFSFWGLLLLRKPGTNTKKENNRLQNLFKSVTPEEPEQLPLSQMNLSGLGQKMLKKMISDQQAPNLSSFLQKARNNGVRFYGCKLSVEVMGFEKDELIPEVEIKTAEDYLKNALKSEIQLFI
ncbi:MAG: DsrE/DsrF/DrsH-like family protein [Bacillota bacterium]